MQKLAAGSLAMLLVAGQLSSTGVAVAQHSSSAPTATPIKHLVVIFDENISFDHYFGTYPYATNPKGEPAFTPAAGTPSVNGYTDGLLHNNPNFLNTTLNGANASNPFRLDRTQAATADQDHAYTPEQEAFDGGLMDGFPKYTGTPGPPPAGLTTKGLVMGYYDGNTVTALWNYAQQFAMNDNSFGTNFGPSTVGAINLISGQTGGVDDHANVGVGSTIVPDGGGAYTDIGDADPLGDACAATDVLHFSGQNIGDLLNARGVTWGFFEGGFDLQTTNANGSNGCTRSHTSAVTGVKENDYIPHHQPFQYYDSTRNEQHTRPTSVQTIGYQGDAANHEYDVNDFYTAVSSGNFPAVSFLKAAGYQDGHAGYSDPLDEQNFIVHVINFLQQQKDWDSTAVVIAYDDSDGWYDHQMGPIVNQSSSTADALTNGSCGNGSSALPSTTATNAQGRCGYGPRLPLLVISPYAKQNFVDHTVTDQSSILRFIEDNWVGGQRIEGSFDARAGVLTNMFDFDHPQHGFYYLNESTGEPTSPGSVNGQGNQNGQGH